VLYLAPGEKCISMKNKYFMIHEWSYRCPCWFQLSSIVAEQTLKSVGAKGMVVGHTPQIHGVNWYLSFSFLNWIPFYAKDFQ
jgi:hypothetical protein